MKINILGAYATKFGELWSVSPRKLAKEAMINALNASGIKASQVDALFVGNMLSGMLGNQTNLGSLRRRWSRLSMILRSRVQRSSGTGTMAIALANG